MNEKRLTDLPLFEGLDDAGLARKIDAVGLSNVSLDQLKEASAIVRIESGSARRPISFRMPMRCFPPVFCPRWGPGGR